MSQHKNIDTHTDDLLHRVGRMTRSPHESLCGVILDKLSQSLAKYMPDAGDRPGYVKKISEKSVQCVWNTTELSLPLQKASDASVKKSSLIFSGWPVQCSLPEQYHVISRLLRACLNMASTNKYETRAHMLNDFSSSGVKCGIADGLFLLNRPQFKPEGKTDVVANQRQVDDLSGSLVF